MEIPVSIQEPPSRTPRGAGLHAWLQMGFRPLYPLASVWAIVAVAIWIFQPQWLQGRLQGVAWHAHEMLWGFVATVAVGFLLTASANWAGRNPLRGWPLGALCLVWLIARIGLLLPGSYAWTIGSIASVGFFLFAAFVLARVLFRARLRRQYGLPIAVLGLGLLDAAALWAVAQHDIAGLLQWVRAGMGVMALIALLIARRVLPFFAMRAVSGLQIPMLTRSGQLQLWLTGLALLLWVVQAPVPAGVLLVAAGAIALWQLWQWQPRAVLGYPLLWVLYAGYALLGLGLVVFGATLAGLPWRPVGALHLIGMGGFGVLIIGMMTRTALGHLGRPLQADAWMVASYALVLLAVAMRQLALLPTSWTWLAMQASALLWCAAFAVYLGQFLPWLIRPRRDGRPG